MSFITEGSTPIIEKLEREIEALKKENDSLYSQRAEVFKLWDMHKWKLQVALDALNQIELDTRNNMVVGHDNIECWQCGDVNGQARKTLEKIKEE